jgi:hypothetical protein
VLGRGSWLHAPVRSFKVAVDAMHDLRVSRSIVAAAFTHEAAARTTRVPSRAGVTIRLAAREPL